MLSYLLRTTQAVKQLLQQTWVTPDVSATAAQRATAGSAFSFNGFYGRYIWTASVIGNRTWTSSFEVRSSWGAVQNVDIRLPV